MWVALIRVVIVRELISKCAWLLGPRGEDASLLLMVRFAVTGGRRGRGCCGSLLPEGKDVRDCRNVAGEEDLPRNSRSTGGLSFHRPWSRRVARETIWVGAASSSERVLAQIWLKSNSVRFTCGWSCWVPRALRKAGCTIGAAILGEGVRESLSATRSEGSLPPWSDLREPVAGGVLLEHRGQAVAEGGRRNSEEAEAVAGWKSPEEGLARGAGSLPVWSGRTPRCKFDQRFLLRCVGWRYRSRRLSRSVHILEEDEAIKGNGVQKGDAFCHREKLMTLESSLPSAGVDVAVSGEAGVRCSWSYEDPPITRKLEGTEQFFFSLPQRLPQRLSGYLHCR
ncbi:hypothetical protein MLD38_035472 [Melastoma candidum]|uniref:Uncharacterized protein n=1 Tax=Melastoma candidum TaxID=119954 RepID=A0ACB9LH07_9MYRT|nr:hypothetical protein MLD38_035472 [Melastoma candidum]